MWRIQPMWRRNKWWCRTVLMVSTGIVLFYLLPFLLNASARWLLRQDTLAPADLIVSLGGDGLCLRELKAAELYKQGFARQVIVSGYPYGPNLDTSTASQAYLYSLGLPASDVRAMPGGRNTRIEADNITALMRAQRWRSAIIVTSPFHARRALFTFERAAPDLKFSSAPVPPQAPEWQPDRWWTRRADLGVTVREWLALGNTWINGWK